MKHRIPSITNRRIKELLSTTLVFMSACILFSSVIAQPSIQVINDLTVDEGASLNLPGIIDISGSNISSVVISSVSNEAQTLNSTNSGIQTDPFPFNADDFIVEAITTNDGTDYVSDLTISPIYGAGGMDASGDGSYTVTITAVDDNGTNDVSFNVIVNAAHQSIAATGTTLIEAESFYNQGPTNAGSGNNGIGVEIDITFTNIGFTHDGDFVEYLIDVPQAGAYEFDFLLAKGTNVASTLSINSTSDGISLGSADNNGWPNYSSRKAISFLPAGQQVLRFDWSGAAGFMFNIDYFTLELLPNQAPVIDAVANQSSVDGDVISGLIVSANDVESNTITFSDGGSLPTGLSINGTSGEISGTIDANASVSSPYTVTITASDDGSPSESSNIQFEWEVVSMINNSPTIDAIADIAVAEGGLVSAAIQVNDDTDPSATIEIYDISNGSGNPSYGTAISNTLYTFTDNGSGSYSLSWSTNVGDAKAYQAVVTANDGVNPAVISVFDIDVATPIPGLIESNTFTNPLPFYGSSPPTSGYTVAIETTPVQNIGYIDNGDFVDYSINVGAAGLYKVTILAGKGNGGTTTCTLSEDNGGFSSIGSVPIVQTGWQTYAAYSTFVEFANAGIQTLRMSFNGGANIDNLTFVNAYTISASSGGNGSISANGDVQAEEGEDVTFTITPDLGFEIDELTVDGVLVPSALSYTFSNVSADHTIDVTFKAIAGITFDITASAGPNGSIDPDGVTTVLENGSQSYTITPDLGFKIQDVLVDGVSVGAVTSYDFTTVTADATITASFEFDELNINCGGPEVTTGGKTFIADAFFSGGTAFPTGGSAQTTINGTDFSNTTDDEIYKKERYGEYTYAIPVPNGDYIVDLYLAEIFQGVVNAASNGVAGKRIFDINIEGGALELENFDALDVATGGAFLPATAMIKTFTVTVSDGQLDIETFTDVDNAKINAIGIRVDDGSANTPPTITPLSPISVTAGQTVSETVSALDSDGISEFQIKIIGASELPSTEYSLVQNLNSADLLWATMPGDEGNYTATLLAFDGQDVSSSTFDITVAANQAPVITLIGDNPTIVELNGTYTELGATASDPEEGSISPVIIGGATVNTGALGDYIITYNISDALGLAATEVTRTVSVTNPADTEKPVITVLGDNPLNITVGTAFVDPGASASDNVDDDIALTNNIVVGGDVVDVNTTGTYIITYNVSDAANNPADEKTRTVNVNAVPEPGCANSSGSYRVNAGGPSGLGLNGVFEEDQTVSGAGGTAANGTPSPYYVSTGDNTFGSAAAVTNLTGYPDEIFQTERWLDGNQMWEFPANGTYDINLLFNEGWTGEAANPRVFDVVIEGNLVLDDYRPSIAAGGVNIAIVENIQGIVVTDGVLNIDLIQGTQNPAIKGFDICFVSGPANTAPVVSISAPLDGTSADVGTSVTFTGSVTDVEDDDVNITALLDWTSDIVGGSIGTGGSFTTTTLPAGTHTITASVTDAGGLTSEESISFEITIPNAPPSITIDSPISGSPVSRGQAFTVSGTASDAEDGDISADISWSSSDAQAIIDPVNGVGASIDLTLVQPGTTTISANVTDSDGAPAIQEDITVEVPVPEVVFASPNNGTTLNATSINVVLTPTNVLADNNFLEHFHFYINPSDPNDLSGEKRISTASSIGQFAFTFDQDSGDDAVGGGGNGVVVGANTIIVVVADKDHNEFTNTEATARLDFTVVLGQPDADFTISQNPAVCGSEVTFDGSTSTHTGLGLSIISYEWDLDYDGSTFDVDRSGITFDETFTSFQGATDVALRVTDDLPGTPNTSIEVISFSVLSQAPVSNPGGPYVITIGDDLSLDGSGSSDPDVCGDAISTYEWDLDGDDSFDDASGATPILLAADLVTLGLGVGVYDVKLRVTDSQGVSSIMQTTLTINDIPDSVPIISAISDISVDEGQVLNLASLISISDADGDALTVTVSSVSDEPQLLQSANTGAQVDPFPNNAEGFYMLSNIVSGPGSYIANLDLTPTFGDGGGADGDGSGTYTITVQVEDEDLNTITEDFVITVNDVSQFIANDAVSKIEAESFDNQGPANTQPGGTGDANGIGVEVNDPGVTNIGFTNDGDFAEYLIDVESAGFFDITFQVAKSSGAAATMTINGGPVSISVSPTGGWQNYTSITAQVFLAAGPQTLRFDWSGAGFLFNMDYFEFTPLADNSPPVITLLGDNPLLLDLGTAYVEAGATATDNVDGDISGNILIDASSVDVNTEGTYNVTYNVDDAAGNPATEVIRQVEVSIPNTAPSVSITNPLDNATEIVNTLLTFSGTAGDTEDGDISASIQWSSDLDGPIGTGASFDYSLLSVGVHIITASVEDLGGLTAQASISITIENTDTPPSVSISAPSDGDPIVRGSTIVLMGTANDTEDGDISALIQWSSDDPSAFFTPLNGIGSSVDLQLVRPGATTITATITDQDNNTEFETITVNVSTPEISFVQPLEGSTLNSRSVMVEVAPVGTIPNNAEHYHFYINPTDINNLDDQSRISTASDPFQNTFVFDENSGALALNGAGNGIVSGSNTILVFAADQFHEEFTNEEAADTVTFMVLDNTPPVISLVGLNPQVFELGDTYTELGATASDDFDGDITANIVIDASAIDMNVAGDYLVTYNVVDAAGNPALEVTRTVTVNALDGIPQVLFEITPGSGIGGSTFGSNDNFQITNQSTGTVRITKITIDLTTAILPDMVFDPVGAGGDETAQCFTPNPTKATATGLVSPTDPCVDPFQAPRFGGYDIISLDFTDFNPTEDFTFSVDIDPNSIKDGAGAGLAGAVSGLELAGATISVEFEGGFTIVSNLYEDGSFGGSQLIGPGNLPAPTISASGAVSNPSTAYNASQDITICGEPNAYYSLMQIDARLHIKNGLPPFNVPDPTYYANELVDKILYNGQFDSEGKVTISVPLLLTEGSGGEPDGGLNYFMAVQSDQPYAANQAVSGTSETITLLYDDDPTLSEVIGTLNITNAFSQEFDATVALYQGTTLVNSYTVSTNASGQFSLPNITPGNYDFWIKNSKTLAILVSGSLTPGPNSIDFGQMISGDFQDDNDIDIVDFSGFANSFGINLGEPSYNAQADFNFDDAISITDFSMFANSFGSVGASPPQASGKINQEVDKSTSMTNARFKLDVEDDTSIKDLFESKIGILEIGENTSSTEVHLLYQKGSLEIIDVLIPDQFQDQIKEKVNTENGIVTFEIGDLKEGDFDEIVTIVFRKLEAKKTKLTLVSKEAFITKEILTQNK